MPSKTGKEFLEMITHAVASLTASCANAIGKNSVASSENDLFQAKLDSMSAEELVKFVKAKGDWDKPSIDIVTVIANANTTIAAGHLGEVVQNDNQKSP
ncbi:MAG: hypothetical protein Q8R24_02545 [Legionellaceae bacterium]|nr:hypothetical protein [Legionellaceae bacterium]